MLRMVDLQLCLHDHLATFSSIRFECFLNVCANTHFFYDYSLANPSYIHTVCSVISVYSALCTFLLLTSFLVKGQPEVGWFVNVNATVSCVSPFWRRERRNSFAFQFNALAICFLSGLTTLKGKKHLFSRTWRCCRPQIKSSHWYKFDVKNECFIRLRKLCNVFNLT